jgi:UDP-N-acetylglucosamine/UDP-N-acetylgalactosamine 4-epimerase
MKVLVTGGAGFIGSNLVEALLNLQEVSFVRVLDNLATGSEKNISEFYANPKFEFIKGDIRDYETCLKSMKGIDSVSHQAALGSVPRSIKDPITSNDVNIGGTLNIFTAAKDSGIKKIVYAASSSTYGDSETLPKVEDKIGKPLSPYAVTKYVNELYADVFKRLYDIDIIGLRYFNVFGPKQNPNGPYAAVIPLFVEAVLNNTHPFINGDGSQSRDFTYVANAVQANIKALFCEDSTSWNQVYNIAYGERTTVLELFNTLKGFAGSSSSPVFREKRIGDIPHSLADISKAKSKLQYLPEYSVKQGLEKALIWYKGNPKHFE